MNTLQSKHQSKFFPTQGQRDELFQLAMDAINRFYETIEHKPLTTASDPSQIFSQLEEIDFDHSRNANELLQKVIEKIELGSLHVTHPRYFGLFNPSPGFYGILADLLVAAYNPQLGAWHHNPIGVAMEAKLIRYFARLFGMNDSAFGHFTSGGSEANFTSVCVALTRMFPEFTDTGTARMDGRPAIYCSTEFHHSFVKIAHQCGIGRSAVRLVPVTSNFVMDPNALRQRVKEDREHGWLPFMVVGTAGTTNAGLVEPLRDIAAVAHELNLHFHVDAAWGGAVILCEQGAEMLDGIGLADTITFDAHKWLSVPMGAGMVFVREHAWLQQTFGLETDYVPQSETDNLDNYRLSCQFSRRFIGLKLFMMLATMGRAGYGEVIQHQIEMAYLLTSKLEAAGFEVPNGGSLGVVCFIPPSNWSVTEHEQFESIAKFVVNSRDAWISTTKLGGRSVLRACITNHATREQDLDRLIELIHQWQKEKSN